MTVVSPNPVRPSGAGLAEVSLMMVSLIIIVPRGGTNVMRAGGVDGGSEAGGRKAAPPNQRSRAAIIAGMSPAGKYHS